MRENTFWKQFQRVFFLQRRVAAIAAENPKEGRSTSWQRRLNMDKCGKCKHKISTNENIMLSICEIYNNENIVNKYAMTAKCAKCGAVLQKSIPQWWATEMVQIAILLFWFLSVKMMENHYIIKILIAAIEAVLLYLLYKFCISTIYAVIPWREAAHSTEEALHEKMLRYNLICRTLTVIFICFCMQIVL